MTISFDDLIPGSGATKAPSPLPPDERDIAIRTIYGEAADESPEGKAAVAAVIRNRLKTGRWGQRVADVVLAKNQFEPWNNSESRRRMEELREDDPRYEEIGKYVDDVFGGRSPDPTNGSTHFFAPRAQAALGRNVPNWARGQEGQRIGNHTFYAPEGRVESGGPNFDDLLPGSSPVQQEQGLSFEDLIPPGNKEAATPGGVSQQDAWAQVPIPEGIPEAAKAAPQRPFIGGTIESLTNPNSYAHQAMSATGRGVVELGAQALRGAGAQVTAGAANEGTALERAIELAGSGVDPSDAAKQGAAEATTRPVTSSPVYQAGEAISDTASKIFPDNAVLNPVVKDVFQGIGSVGGNVALSLVPGIGTSTLFVTGVLAGSGEAAQRAVKKGATPEQQVSAAQLGQISGATEIADALLGRLGSTGKAAGFIARVGMPALIGAATQGGQEGLQQWIQNKIAQGVYDPSQDLTEDIAYNALIGGIVGGTISGGIATVQTMPVQAPRPSADVIAHYLATTNMGTARVPDAVLFSAGNPPPSPLWYSTVRKTVEEKGPAAASGEQWLATLQNTPGVKKEELADLGLESYFLERGRVTKDEVIEHLEERQVRVEEVLQDLDRAEYMAQYEEYVAPGPRKNYRELLLKTPERGSWADDNLEIDFRGSHWNQPNVIAHVRSTERVDNTDTPVLHLEEIQSDWHQTGRKHGYKITDPSVFSNPIKVGTTRDGRQMWMFDTPDRGSMFAYGDTEQAARQQLLETLNLSGRRTPPGPFKTSWPELAFKRMIRWAADNGYSRITWSTGKMAADHAAGGLAQNSPARRGLTEFYDNIVPGIAKKWAKRLGGSIGTTMIPVEKIHRYEVGLGLPGDTQYYIYDEQNRLVDGPFPTREAAVANLIDLGLTAANIELTPVMYMDIPPQAQSIVRKGLPLYSATSVREATFVPSEARQQGYDPKTIQIATKIRDVLNSLIKTMKIDAPIRIRFSNTHPNYHGWVVPRADGSYDLAINPDTHPTAGAMYATAVHEFGHIVMFEKFAKAPAKVQQAVKEAYETWALKLTPSTQMTQVIQTRDNAVVNYYNMRGDTQHPLYMLSPERRRYWTGFDEWFAEQVARWATTSERPLSIVDKTFSQLGKWVRKVLEAAYNKFGLTFEPDRVMKEWLDSYIDHGPALGHEIAPGIDLRTQQQNQDALDRTVGEGTVDAAPRAPGTQTVVDGLEQLTEGGTPQMRESAAWNERGLSNACR